MKILLSLIVLSSALTVGCTTTSNELTVKKVNMKDRVYAGRIFVEFNGKKNPDLKCEIYINRGLVPDIKLTADGYLFFKSNSASFRLTKISCYDQPDFYRAAWHHQSLPLEKVFKPESFQTAVYFGDIYINWKTDPAETVAAANLDATSPAYPKVGHVQNSGLLKIEVKDDFEAMKLAFAERVKNKSWNAEETPFTLEKHTVQISSAD